MRQTFSLKIFCSCCGTLYFPLPSCHRFENRTSQLKKVAVGCARTLSEASWLSTLDHLPHRLWFAFHSHPTFFTRGSHKLLHNSREPDILRNVIVSGYVTFYQISKCFAKTLFFHHWQNVCATGWTVFAGRIWLAGRSLEQARNKLAWQIR